MGIGSLLGYGVIIYFLAKYGILVFIQDLKYSVGMGIIIGSGIFLKSVFASYQIAAVLVPLIFMLSVCIWGYFKVAPHILKKHKNTTLTKINGKCIR